MTKIKNTKKGMAKKTLSVSLAVAMLATSNVPVWAAEFSDGSEAVFTSEVEEEVVEETPAVEEEVAPVAEITEASDLISTDVTVSKSATFGTGTVNVSGNIYYKEDGELKELETYSFGWRVKGTTEAIFTDNVGADNTTAKMAFAPDFTGNSANNHSQAQTIDWSNYVGQTLELYIFNNLDSTDSMKINPTVIGETVINKCEIKGTLKLNKGATELIYNGKDFYYTNDSEDTSVNAVKLVQRTSNGTVTLDVTGGDLAPGTDVWNKNSVLKYFDVSATKTAKNADETLVVTATAKADSPYIGTVSATPITIQKRSYNSDEFEFTVDDDLSYSYIGNHDIVIPTEKVHFKETDALSEADLSAAVKTVKVSSTILH